MQYRVISKNSKTGEAVVVISEMRGVPLTLDQARDLATRFTAAEGRREVTYHPEVIPK